MIVWFITMSFTTNDPDLPNQYSCSVISARGLSLVMGLSHGCWCLSSKVDTNSDDDSSRRRRVVAVRPRPSLSPSSSSGLHQPPRSLLAGRWLLLSTENLEAYDQVVAVTDTDMDVNRMMRRGPNIHTFQPISSDEIEWSSTFESGYWDAIKVCFWLGEEFDEMTPSRQLTRSVYYMPDINTMTGIRTYRNGTQAYVERKVMPSDPDKLVVTLTSGGVTCTRIHRHISDDEYAWLMLQPPPSSRR